MEAACPAAPLSLSLSSLQPPPLARCPGATNWWYLSCNLVSSCLCTHMEHLFQLPLSLHTQAPVPAASLSTHTGTCSSCLSLYTRGTCSSCLSLHTRAPVPAASLSTHTSTCSSCLSLHTRGHLFQLPLSLHTRAPVPAASLSTHTSTCSSCLSLYTHGAPVPAASLSTHTSTCSSCLSLYTHEHLFQLPLSLHTRAPVPAASLCTHEHLFQLPLSLHTRAPVPAASLYTHGAPVPAASLSTHTGHLFQLPLSLHTRGTCSSCLSLHTRGTCSSCLSLHTRGTCSRLGGQGLGGRGLRAGAWASLGAFLNDQGTSFTFCCWHQCHLGAKVRQTSSVPLFTLFPGIGFWGLVSLQIQAQEPDLHSRTGVVLILRAGQAIPPAGSASSKAHRQGLAGGLGTAAPLSTHTSREFKSEYWEIYFQLQWKAET
ncbi:uncharacterized protein LOC126944305 isoform X43 [Macaca thibetana thibetana]|uniref:uncharacterized protein LOC126944305 isoform X43 n=1 Tax=Macaca thibetana thibetana TaxID=257877 RepID=UPI0021BC550D|nr:uncharacterized protein LOC126944305 isoform X43 [Macaca thibetana thibetana]